MDTCAQETVTTDSLGRRTGPRTQHTIEEKLCIVQETHVRGASVATVARRHNINPNQVFAWRQLYRRGLLNPNAAPGSGRLLSVRELERPLNGLETRLVAQGVEERVGLQPLEPRVA